jgi:hypothetical protein
MNRIASLIAIAAAGLTLASAAGPVVGHADAKQNAKQRSCLTKGETVAKKNSSRLYVVERKDGEQFYFACSAKYGRHVKVFDDCCDEIGTPSAGFNGDFAVVQYVGYGVDGEAAGGLEVWNLRTGKSIGAAADVERDGISDLEDASPMLLQADGRLAWIGIASGDKDLGKVVEVRTLVRGKPKTLDRGTGIDPKSLKVSGSTITWTKDGVAKTGAFGSGSAAGATG